MKSQSLANSQQSLAPSKEGQLKKEISKQKQALESLKLENESQLDQALPFHSSQGQAFDQIEALHHQKNSEIRPLFQTSKQEGSTLMIQEPENKNQEHQSQLNIFCKQKLKNVFPAQDSVVFYQSSKFFCLFLLQNKDPEVQLQTFRPQKQPKPKTMLSQPQSQQNTSKKQLTLKEWFNNISIEERIFALSTVDSYVTSSIKRMKTKIQRHGYGKFKFSSKVITIGGNLAPPKMQSQFNFVSIRKTLKNNSNEMNESKKMILEKELLDYVCFSTTFEKWDTLTVSKALVSSPSKLFNLLEMLTDQGSLKTPFEITFEKEVNLWATTTPSYFDPFKVNSISVWIVFILERALWINYSRQNFGTYLTPNLITNFFVNPKGKVCHYRIELFPFWERLKTSENILQEIKNEIQQKANESLDQQSDKRICNFTGGYQSSKEQDSIILNILLAFQSENLIQNLCLMPIQECTKQPYAFKLQKIIAKVLIEKQKQMNHQGSFNLEQCKKNQKNKLKKQKKKQQKIKKQEEKSKQFELIRELQEHTNNQLALLSKSPEVKEEKKEEKKEEIKNEKKQIEESEDDDSEVDLDFVSNEVVLKKGNYEIDRIISQKPHDELISLLIFEEEKKSIVQHLSKEVLKEISQSPIKNQK